MIYAVGDIHGYSDQLERALALIEADGGPDARIVFIGDYNDRGPDSRGVITRLREGVAAGRNWVCIAGNHDRMLRWFVTQGIEHDVNVRSGISWLNVRLGGAATLASYGVVSTEALEFGRDGEGRETLEAFCGKAGKLTLSDLVAEARAAVPQADLDFLATRPLWHREEGLIFVHAGLRPGIALEHQAEDDLLWIRQGWLHDTRDHGALVVHGHTALDMPQHHGNRVNIDGGAGYGNPLVPVVFDEGRVWTLGNAGRSELTP